MSYSFSYTSTDLQSLAVISSSNNSSSQGTWQNGEPLSDVNKVIIIVVLIIVFNIFALLCIPCFIALMKKPEQDENHQSTSPFQKTTVTIDRPTGVLSVASEGIVNQFTTYSIHDIDRIRSGLDGQKAAAFISTKQGLHISIPFSSSLSSHDLNLMINNLNSDLNNIGSTSNVPRYSSAPSYNNVPIYDASAPSFM
ncbi:hypothetical protein P9112_000011 [Eukaryota sp. TZLM1-RC]